MTIRTIQVKLTVDADRLRKDIEEMADSLLCEGMGPERAIELAWFKLRDSGIGKYVTVGEVSPKQKPDEWWKDASN